MIKPEEVALLLSGWAARRLRVVLESDLRSGIRFAIFCYIHYVDLSQIAFKISPEEFLEMSFDGYSFDFYDTKNFELTSGYSAESAISGTNGKSQLTLMLLT